MVALESAELFRNLKSDELRALRQVTLERQFMTGQEIFREGDPGDGVYVVKDGQVEISSLMSGYSFPSSHFTVSLDWAEERLRKV